MGSDLAGKIALVTGGGRGIGRSISLALASDGSSVVVNYHRDRGAAEQVAQAALDLGAPRAITVQADVGNEEDVVRMVGDTVDQLGVPDILVNNAAVITRTPVLEMTKQEFDSVMGTNLGGCFLVSREVARVMVERHVQGRIINITSISERFGTATYSHYCASKAAIWMLTRVLALELAQFGIVVNAVAPGLIVTDINRDFLANPENYKDRVARVTLGYPGDPDSVGKMVAFLAGPNAEYVTGQSYPVDGGYGLH